MRGCLGEWRRQSHRQTEFCGWSLIPGVRYRAGQYIARMGRAGYFLIPGAGTGITTATIPCRKPLFQASRGVRVCLHVPAVTTPTIHGVCDSWSTALTGEAIVCRDHNRRRTRETGCMIAKLPSESTQLCLNPKDNTAQCCWRIPGQRPMQPGVGGIPTCRIVVHTASYWGPSACIPPWLHVPQTSVYSDLSSSIGYTVPCCFALSEVVSWRYARRYGRRYGISLGVLCKGSRRALGGELSLGGSLSRRCFL